MNEAKNLINVGSIADKCRVRTLPRNNKKTLEHELAALVATSRKITRAKARFLKKELPAIQACRDKASAQKIKSIQLEHFHMARLRNKIGVLSVQLKVAQKAHAQTLYKSSSALSKSGTTVKDNKHAADMQAQ
ncbi:MULTISPECIES: hypothetical protein [Polaromonas]|uniref:Uncharacterized protein n=1 Tax=Polaromonas aquatica TaxID=332657 RepID=A0ABW1U4Y3_9BURK